MSRDLIQIHGLQVVHARNAAEAGLLERFWKGTARIHMTRTCMSGKNRSFGQETVCQVLKDRLLTKRPIFARQTNSIQMNSSCALVFQDLTDRLLTERPTFARQTNSCQMDSTSYSLSVKSLSVKSPSVKSPGSLCLSHQSRQWVQPSPCMIFLPTFFQSQISLFPQQC